MSLYETEFQGFYIEYKFSPFSISHDLNYFIKFGIILSKLLKLCWSSTISVFDLTDMILLDLQKIITAV